MGVSNSVFSICKVQGNLEFITYANKVNSYAIPSKDYIEPYARMPTLKEIYQALKKAKIQITNERIKRDAIDKKLTVHIFNITDNEIDYSQDLTVKYETGQSSKDTIRSISGIKTHARILIKLTTQLSESCGSFYILNPYDIIFIQKGKKYNEIWGEINNMNS